MESTPEVVVVAVLVVVVTGVLLFRFRWKPANLPPGPPALPIIGSFHLLGTRPHHNLTAMARKYGPLMSVRLGQKLTIVVSSSDAARELLKFQDPNFCVRPRTMAADIIMFKDVFFNPLTPVIRTLLKMMQRELTSAKRFEASKDIRSEELAFLLQAIARKKQAPIGVKTYFHAMTTNILSRMVMNKRFISSDEEVEASGEAKEFRDILQGMQDCLGAIHPKDFFSIIPKWVDPMGVNARFRKQRARMDAFYTKVIAQHREYRQREPVRSEDDKTMLDVLLELVDSEESEVTEEHAKGVTWDVLSAGIDTSVLTSEWAMAEIMRNPSVMTKLQAELDQVVGNTRTMQESDVPQLKYLQAVVKETLRLHAALPMLPHMSINPCKVMGYDIPGGTRALINVWGIARDPQNWKNPLEFCPDRFLEEESDQEFLGHHYKYLPFGSGRRSCPGTRLGVNAVNVGVGSLVHAFNWGLPDGLKLEEIDLSEGFSFTIPLDKPLIAVATPRLPLHVYRT